MSKIIEKKRDGFELDEEEIKSFIEGYLSGTIPDYQMSAFLMAVVFRKMTPKETSFLTQSYINKSLQWENRVYDKHSCGGVGDKVSLILGPILAAGGLQIPMIAGRGLSFTGGTVDKLESIKNYRTDLTFEEIQKQVEKIGICITGQTAQVASADGRIYALRDCTGTVGNVNLITASIVAKKVSAGVSCLAMDYKFGKGAIFKTIEEVEELAKSIKDTAKHFGVDVFNFFSNMDEPLGFTVGNRLEVIESIEFLENKKKALDLAVPCYLISAVLFRRHGICKSLEDGIKFAKKLVAEGEALKKFQEMVKFQSGELSLPLESKSEYESCVFSDRDGYVKSIDALEIGTLLVDLGAGRQTMADELDLDCGVVLKKKKGDRVKKGELVGSLFYTKKGVDVEKFSKAFEFSEDREEPEFIRYIECPEKQEVSKLIDLIRVLES